MPFFGKSKKRNASHANYSSINLPQAPFLESSCPPPYQAFAEPPQQHSYPHPCPYSHPQLSSTHLPRRLHHGPYQHNGPSTSQLQLQKWSSCTNLPAVTPSGSRLMDLSSSRRLYDMIGDKFSDVVSLIDEEVFPGGERELVITLDPAPSPYISPPQQYDQPVIRGGAGKERGLWPSQEKHHRPDKHQVYSQDRSINVVSKVSLYANSRLPSQLPPLRVYTSSWPLICLAAQYSNNAYKKPIGAEKDTFVRPDVHLGTKAMVIKSVPVDDMNTIVFAIRGTSLLSPRDWGV